MDNITQFAQFRSQVYQNLNKCNRADVLMDLLDALSSNTSAYSVVELSLMAMDGTKEDVPNTPENATVRAGPMFTMS